MKISPVLLGAAIISLPLAGATFAQNILTLKFTDAAWDGQKVPDGQQYPLNGGKGATPAIEVSGLPEGTVKVNLAFNDETYTPMNNGGHGIIGFDVAPSAGVALLPSVPGNTADLPAGASVTAASRGTGPYASPGYLPPCSGGSGNHYSATATALDASDAKLASGRIELGIY